MLLLNKIKDIEQMKDGHSYLGIYMFKNTFPLFGASRIMGHFVSEWSTFKDGEIFFCGQNPLSGYLDNGYANGKYEIAIFAVYDDNITSEEIKTILENIESAKLAY